ncbi:hypothetical protein ACOTCG_17125 [Achromobacter xylosoxidans]
MRDRILFFNADFCSTAGQRFPRRGKAAQRRSRAEVAIALTTIAVALSSVINTGKTTAKRHGKMKKAVSDFSLTAF